ncbi:MAG: hypothetical protein AB7O57_18460 [Hyphomicrobiaceae bacterium]
MPQDSNRTGLWTMLGVCAAVGLVALFPVMLRIADEETRLRDLGCRGDLCLSAEVTAAGASIKPASRRSPPPASFRLDADCLDGTRHVLEGESVSLPRVPSRKTTGYCIVEIAECETAPRARVSSCSPPIFWQVHTLTFSAALRAAFRSKDPW